MQRNLHSPDARRGFTLLEIIAGAAMLTVLLGVSAQALIRVNQFQKKTDQRIAAMEALQNAMEELTSKPWDEVSEPSIAALKLPREMSERWPDMKLDGHVATVHEPVEGKRITLFMKFGGSHAGRASSLTTWVFREGRR